MTNYVYVLVHYTDGAVAEHFVPVKDWDEMAFRRVAGQPDNVIPADSKESRESKEIQDSLQRSHDRFSRRDS